MLVGKFWLDFIFKQALLNNIENLLFTIFLIFFPILLNIFFVLLAKFLDFIYFLLRQLNKKYILENLTNQWEKSKIPILFNNASLKKGITNIFMLQINNNIKDLY